MPEKIVKVKRDTVCNACRQKILRGDRAAARATKFGFQHFCLECYRRIVESEVFVYQPPAHSCRRRYIKKRVENERGKKSCFGLPFQPNM